MRTIKDIMNPRVRTVSETDSAEEAFKLMGQEGFHHLVVMRENRVVGVIAERDLGGVHGGAVRQDKTVGDLMSSNPITIDAGESIRMAAKTLLGSSIGCLPVVDDHTLVGLVTVSDLLELIADSPQRNIARVKPKRAKSGFFTWLWV